LDFDHRHLKVNGSIEYYTVSLLLTCVSVITNTLLISVAKYGTGTSIHPNT